MVTKYQKFGDGYKAEAVKLYRESNQTIAETARNLGLKESTLANWVKKDKDNEAVAAGEAPLTPAERTRIRELEADVRRLNMENAFLKKGGGSGSPVARLPRQDHYPCCAEAGGTWKHYAPGDHSP